jgi:hypothetical protein
MKRTPSKKNRRPKPPTTDTKATSKIDSNFVPRLGDGVVYRTNMDGAIAVMQLDNEKYFFKIDGLAKEVWAHIDGKRTVKAIVAKITPPRQSLIEIEKKTLVFIRDLIKANLLRRPE